MKLHWDNVYYNKNENEVSWYQKIPKTSLDHIKSLNLNLDSKIIDVGAGESRLVDNLLDLGFNNIDVLDISKKSIEKAKNRLGEKSEKINWIVSDINDFVSNNKYDLWHDRAAFHFLKDSSQINNYVELANSSLNSKGKIILGTFSSNGPLKCSGLEISRYNSSSINEIFKKHFILLNHRISIHPTPFDTFQEFLFTVFEKK
ncbi:MAG: methyltransferase domain-containing protein [Flavobacteriaceae bacterium]|nr:methyltransferase domain-containing protein [Flavobacteriaceae bacterium]MBT4415300.1 methyltransferase domain-containing protein [Flavobacteriaceae bacterium]MBT5011812.1 methyltransferase domain-containing protein [Flavobacteriaceae bacterium]MBT5856972.1 methyltransferase domain-containing protein [Flavobacteriaceae bacterium]MBT6689188.1 methyltransferase domain-containing protein [Flavobacteriaceae bacterium]